MIKYLVAAIVVALALGAVYYYGVERKATVSAESQGSVATNERTDTSAKVSPWTFKEAGEKNGVPLTKVSFKVNGTVKSIGTYEGNCGDMAGSSWTMRNGETYGAICWFAGGGTEIGVFMENGKHVVKTAILDEGTAEGGAVRGDMVALLTL